WPVLLDDKSDCSRTKFLRRTTRRPALGPRHSAPRLSALQRSDLVRNIVAWGVVDEISVCAHQPCRAVAGYWVIASPSRRCVPASKHQNSYLHQGGAMIERN